VSDGLESATRSAILYLSCDSFINQFMNAVQAQRHEPVRGRYRNVDCWSSTTSTSWPSASARRRKFFHTFNTLFSGEQADHSVGRLPAKRNSRVGRAAVSRFNWGMWRRIEKPCYETRVAILKKKAACAGLVGRRRRLPHRRAHRHQHRELEGAITKLQGMSLLTNTTIDLI